MRINQGEDTRHQFKRDFIDVDGLGADDIRRLSQMLSNGASQHIKPPYDREERISPDHLPNHLDTEQIRFGHSNLRNPTLASHAFHLLPYRGLGSGISRVIAAWPEVELHDDRRGNQIIVTVRRHTAQPDQFAEGVSEGVTSMLAQIQQTPGLRSPKLATQMNTSVKNIERWLQKLKDQQKIEFRGAPKTGGYYLKRHD